jgi:hypothetical protein
MARGVRQVPPDVIQLNSLDDDQGTMSCAEMIFTVWTRILSADSRILHRVDVSVIPPGIWGAMA